MADTQIDEKLLATLSEEERGIVLKTLKNLSNGDDTLYNDLRYAEYREIPVDILTFLDDDRYLGKAWHDVEGNSKLYPYWRNKLTELFPDNINTEVNNVIFSGSRGLGKSELAVAICCYEIYRVLCLKNPREYFGLKPTETITVAFMNLTLEAAQEIAISKFQNTIQMSPWFLEHGTLSGRTNIVWNPPEYMNIIIGSQSSDLVGRAVYFCLDGDTIIATDKGDKKIKDCVDQNIRVFSRDNGGNIVLSDPCTVKPTIKTKEEYQIELEDGSIIRCTANHRFMLKDGSYKEAQYLTENDELMGSAVNGGTPEGCVGARIKSVERVELDEEKQYYDVINANPCNNFWCRTKDGYINSHNCFFDEISFLRNKDIDKQKEMAMDMINTAIGGMKTRFIRNGVNNSLLVLASSKRSDKSFLETYMKKQVEVNGDNLMLVDEAIWNVKPEGTYSKQTFPVGVGNKFLTSQVIEDEWNLQRYIDKGYRIIQVPIDFKSDFQTDIDRALCDFAGISSTELSKYISGEAWAETRDDNLRNPFETENDCGVIEVGDGADDPRQYRDFFNMDKVDKKMMRRPLFIHLDMSISGDKTGIAGVWIKSKDVARDGEDPSNELHFQLAFAVSVKAPKGHQVSFDKNRKFIYWLKDKGFKIAGVSTDSFSSADFSQSLISKGYNYTQLSVDRVDRAEGSYICRPYQYFRSCIYEHRISTFYDEQLTNEIIELERNINTGKVDHPDGGCFTGDTRVKLCTGGSESFLELCEDYQNGIARWVHTYNLDTGAIESKPVKKAWCTLKDQPLIKLTFNDGSYAKCTYNHRFLMQDSSYVEAKDLPLNERLKSYYGYMFVTAKEELDEREDVYDIEVGDNHNFALESGVFVHNSKDQADATAGAVYMASQNAEQFAYDYGETLTETLKANASASPQDIKTQMNVEFEQEIQKMFNPKSIQKIQEEEKKKDEEKKEYSPAFTYDGMLIW